MRHGHRVSVENIDDYVAVSSRLLLNTDVPQPGKCAHSPTTREPRRQRFDVPFEEPYLVSSVSPAVIPFVPVGDRVEVAERVVRIDDRQAALCTPHSSNRERKCSRTSATVWVFPPAFTLSITLSM